MRDLAGIPLAGQRTAQVRHWRSSKRGFSSVPCQPHQALAWEGEHG
jgi:hypothetical protein